MYLTPTKPACMFGVDSCEILDGGDELKKNFE